MTSKKLGLEQVAVVFGVIMVLLVLSGAAAITFTDFLSDRLQGTKRAFFIVLLLAYGIYRSIRVYQMIRYRRNQHSSPE